MKSSFDTVTITNDKHAANELEVSVVLRGKPEAVVGAMVNGFPRAAIESLRDAFDEELRRRKDQ